MSAEAPLNALSVAVPRDLLESLVDDSDCRFDHHGGCQEHGYISLEQGEICPQEELKRLLDAPVGDARFVYDEIKAKYASAYESSRRVVAYEGREYGPDYGDASWALVELDEAFRDLWSIESDAS